VISVVWALVCTVTLGRLCSFFTSTASAFSSGKLDHRDVAHHAGQVDGRLDAGVAAADHRHVACP
jgi:hypothetical protein